jgi:mRNA-degrading endonuclease toxin of MazEF toxin-antitoxin module
MMMNERKPKRYEVWWVPFAFPDKPGRSKNRPSVVLQWDGNRRMVLITKVTGNINRNEIGYVVLRDWESAGLLKPSAVRCSQLLDVPRELFLDEGPVGVLSKYDAERVYDAVLQANPGIEL